jgi:hypothetical protein
VIGCASFAIAALLIQGCSTGCNEETVDRAVAFIDAHQSCETDADCVVIDDFCAELPGGYCGQLAMNREGSESSEWRSITADVRDCAPSECQVCAAALIPSCTNNVCSRRL